MAKGNGIKKATVENRVYQLGWDIDRAITTPVRKKKNNISPHLKVARKNGIKETTVRRRIERGWSIERSISTETISSEEKMKKARRNKKQTIIKKKKKSSENYFQKLNQMDFERMKNRAL